VVTIKAVRPGPEWALTTEAVPNGKYTVFYVLEVKTAAGETLTATTQKVTVTIDKGNPPPKADGHIRIESKFQLQPTPQMIQGKPASLLEGRVSVLPPEGYKVETAYVVYTGAGSGPQSLLTLVRQKQKDGQVTEEFVVGNKRDNPTPLQSNYTSLLIPTLPDGTKVQVYAVALCKAKDKPDILLATPVVDLTFKDNPK
jgi:hypothetical protein